MAIDEKKSVDIAKAVREQYEVLASPHIRELFRVDAMRLYMRYEELVRAGFTQMQALYLVSEIDKKD